MTLNKKFYFALITITLATANSLLGCAEFPIYALWDADVLHRWLEGDVDILMVDKHGFTPLHWAAHYGREDTAQQLIAAGARINAKSHMPDCWWQMTPLREAACQGHAGVARLLLRAGASPQELLKAVKNNHLIGVETLLRAGVNPDIQDEHQWTALRYAACFRGQEIVTLLLAAHANANLQDAYGETALHLACWSKKKENVRLLIPHTNLAIKNKWGSTPLKLATNMGHKDIVQLFDTYPSHRQMEAFLALFHPQLGQHSPAKILPCDRTIVRQIYNYLLLYNARPNQSVEIICKGWPWWKNI